MGEITDVVVEADGGRIHLYSAPPWEVPGLLGLIKSIPGANFRKTPDPHWTYPLTIESCRALRARFDDMLVVGPTLAAWANEAMADEANRVRLCHLRNVRLPKLEEWYPDVYKAMRRYQRVGAKFLSQRPSILADQPGLGKTVQLLASLVEGDRLEGVHLICAPVTSLEVVWVKQVLRWLGMDATHLTGSAAKREAAMQEFFAEVEEYPPGDGYAHFLIINPEMLQIKQHKDASNKVVSEDIKYPQFFNRVWTSVTVDEAQDYLIGIRNTNRMTQTGVGMMRLRSAHRVALTGTPMRGRPKNLWGLLHWLYPEKYGSYWQWIETFFDVVDNGFGKEISEQPAEPMKDAFYRHLDTIMIRRTKTEVLKELPPKQYNDIWVDMTPKQLNQYQDMLENSEAKFGDHHIAATGILAELTRMSQIATAMMTLDAPGGKPKPTAESGKFTELMEQLRKRGVSGKKEECWGTEKFVVASQSTEVLSFLEDHLAGQGIATLKIDGSVSQRGRTAAQEAFQDQGGARIMLIQTTTAKAIDLDAQCDEMFVLDETFVPDDQEQLEDRIHRASRIHQVTIHYIRTRDSIDENRKQLVGDKENIQKLVLDGRRGVEFARKLMGR